jgi:hypothetical protein
MRRADIVILNGTSSVGKSTVAGEIQSLCEEPFLHSRIDHFLHNMPRRVFTDFGWFDMETNEGRLSRAILRPLGRRFFCAVYDAIAVFARSGTSATVDDVLYDRDVVAGPLRMHRVAASARPGESGAGGAMKTKSRPWIPPAGLLAGHFVYGLSWLLAASTALTGTLGLGVELAWVHLVALGWITTIALAILVHVVPGFTDAKWVHERLARAAIPVFAAGALLLSAALGLNSSSLLPLAGSITTAALAAYLFAALQTLARPGPERQGRAVAGALALTLAILALTAALGYAFTLALGRGLFPDVLRLAPAHAILGIVGWLTILVTGVSTRTFRPIFGAKSRIVFAHIIVGAALATGTVVAALGVTLRSGVLLDLGFSAIAAGALAYVADGLDIARRATIAHRPPQAFAIASMLWLVAALGFVVAARFGAPALPVAVFIALAGWVGQMVNAHVHHIGIRVLATLVLGDDDETRPQELLDARLSWSTFATAQLAVLLGALGLASMRTEILGFAGLFGFAAFLTLSANIVVARETALRRRPVGSTPTL